MAFLIPGKQYERRRWELLHVQISHYKAISILRVQFIHCKRLVLYWRNEYCKSFPQTILKDNSCPAPHDSWLVIRTNGLCGWNPSLLCADQCYNWRHSIKISSCWNNNTWKITGDAFSSGWLEETDTFAILKRVFRKETS